MARSTKALRTGIVSSVTTGTLRSFAGTFRGVAVLLILGVTLTLSAIAYGGDKKDSEQPETTTSDDSDAGDMPAPPPSTEGDIVETFESDASAPPKAPTPPAKPDKLEFRGLARITAAAGAYSLPGDAPGAAPQERVPFDRAFTEQHLYLDMRYMRGAWFQGVVSASLGVAEFVQQNRPSSGAATTSVDYQRFEATVREAYVAFYLGRLDLRIGQQRIAWGNSDAFAPNDVLNGRDLRNPFVFDNEMIMLPSPAIRADVDMGFGVLSGVVEPFLVTDRYDLYGTNWAIVQPDAPLSYRRLFGTLTQGLDRSSVSALQDSLTAGQLNPSNPADVSVGGSLRTHIGKVDFSYYVMTGFDHTPAVFVDPAFQKQLTSIDSTMLNGAVLDALLNEARASNTALGGPIVVSYRRRNHVGMDAQTTLGSFVLRTDIAYDSAKTFFSADTLNAVLKPTVQEVVGLEYQTGNLKKLITFEAWAMQVLDPEVTYVPVLTPGATGSLLWYGNQNFGVANVVRWSFFENVIFEMRSLVGVTPFWYLLRPELGWDSSTLTVRAGFVGIGGSDDSYGHYFRRNSTAYLTTRVSF